MANHITTNIEINPNFYDALDDETRYQVFFGGRGSGKSWFVAQKIMLRVLEPEKQKFLIIMKNGNKLRGAVYQQFKDVIEASGLEKLFDSSTSPLRIVNKLNGNSIEFYGLDSGQKLKSIPGVTGLWFEEATLISKTDFDDVIQLMRATTDAYKQIILTFNPEDISHWINKSFFIGKKYEPFKSYHSTYLDNPYLDQDEYGTMLDSLDEEKQQVAKYGKWGFNSETVVFKNWVVEDIDTNIYNYRDVVASVDFGWTHNGICMVTARTNKEIYIIKEMAKKKLTNDQFIDAIKENVLNWKDLVFYCDSAEPKSIAEMRIQGLDAKGVKKGKGSVKFAEDYLKRLKIIVHPSCTKTIEELQSYQYDKDEATGIIFDKVKNSGLYDCIAALRYAVNNVMREPTQLKIQPSIF